MKFLTGPKFWHLSYSPVLLAPTVTQNKSFGSPWCGQGSVRSLHISSCLIQLILTQGASCLSLCTMPCSLLLTHCTGPEPPADDAGALEHPGSWQGRI